MPIPDTAVLAVDVQVAEAAGLPLVTIPKGTKAADIPDDQRAQLCADHFVSGG